MSKKYFKLNYEAETGYLNGYDAQVVDKVLTEFNFNKDIYVKFWNSEEIVVDGSLKLKDLKILVMAMESIGETK